MNGYSAFTSNNTPVLPTLGDLFMKVKQDNGMPYGDKQDLLEILQQLLAQLGPTATLSSLVMRGMGGVLGALIARYFGAGIIGQTIGAVAGYGIGGSLARQMGARTAPLGYKVIGR